MAIVCGECGGDLEIHRVPGYRSHPDMSDYLDTPSAKMTEANVHSYLACIECGTYYAISATPMQ